MTPAQYFALALLVVYVVGVFMGYTHAAVYTRCMLAAGFMIALGMFSGLVASIIITTLRGQS